tara:strand:+ start:919 stop:2205 length:1287 start_codon:yes stop_codon:yes gene_type:complete
MSEKIAVLGAGPMGLAVAYELIKNGKKPIIFEADDRVGGMTAMFDFNGLDIERYYHFHCTSDNGFLNILKELGIENKMKWKKTKMAYWYDGKIQPWGNPIALLKFKGLSLIAKIRYGIFAFISTKRNNWKKLDKLKADVWVKRWVGSEAYNILWERLFDYKFYHYTNNLSAAWIWSRIRRVGRSRYDLMNEKLGHLEGGSSTLLNALEVFIKNNGGVINLKSPVTKVVIDNSKIAGIETKETFIEFDKVISTIPLPYVNITIPDLPHEISKKFDSVNNIAVVCVIAKLKKSVSENFWMNINDPNMDIPGLVEYSNLRSMENHIVYVPFYMPGEHQKFADNDDVFINKVKKYLKIINEELDDGDFIDIRASRYRFAQPICEPEFMSKLPPRNLSISGLWVADTSYYYPEDRGISESIDFGRSMAKEVID